MATRNTKPIVIPVSFKTSTLDDKMLLDWLEEKFETYGKSNYIKLILKEQMIREIKEKE
jgi:hypothetical protein